MNSFFVDAPGARLYVEDTGGTGVAVLLAHAKSGNALVWQYQQEAFAAAGFRVVVWSRRGSAPTEAQETGAGVSADADIDTLADALQLGRFHAIGTAAGGGVMLHYAIARPERVRTLVIANSLGDLAEEQFHRRIEALRPAPFADLPVELRELGPSYRAANNSGVAEWLERIGRLPPPGTQHTHSGAFANGAHRHDIFWGDVAGLKMPVLWLTGDADLYMPPPLLAEFHGRTAGSELVVIANAGHSAFWECPDDFNAAVLSFIQRRDPG